MGSFQMEIIVLHFSMCYCGHVNMSIHVYVYMICVCVCLLMCSLQAELSDRFSVGGTQRPNSLRMTYYCKQCIPAGGEPCYISSKTSAHLIQC